MAHAKDEGSLVALARRIEQCGAHGLSMEPVAGWHSVC